MVVRVYKRIVGEHIVVHRLLENLYTFLHDECIWMYPGSNHPLELTLERYELLLKARAVKTTKNIQHLKRNEFYRLGVCEELETLTHTL